jgi:hypothetical protein
MPLFVFLMEQKDTEQQELGEKKEKEEKYALQFGSLPETVRRREREESRNPT